MAVRSLIIVQPSEGAAYPAIPNLTCKVSSEETGDAFTVLEFRIGPEGGAGLHTHIHEDEIVFVKEGECVLGTADEEWTAPVGTVVVFPKGTTHRFHNRGPEACVLLITAVPGGLDRYFQDVSDAIEAEQPGRLDEINTAHGIEFIS
jgi:quercetin dioxygenase-like cupin family protein